MAPLISKLFSTSMLLPLLFASLLAAEARPSPTLASRLQSDGMAQCWGSLMELRACTGEVILFFLNGETYLGPSCCRAIHVIQHSCWGAEAMLTALGFTAEEGDVLRGYCDAVASAPPPPPAAPGPFGGALE